MDKQLKIGSTVVFIDARGQRHNALVTHVWPLGAANRGGTEPGCNLVMVDGDDSKKDPYGRQIARQTSVCHVSVQPAGCHCWCWPDE